MNINELKVLRHEILVAINEEFNDAQIAAMISDEDGIIPETVNAVLDEIGDTTDEARGQFFFKPLVTDEDQVQYFTSLIIISNEIPKDRLGELYEAMSYLNISLPTGCFAIDKDHGFLAYILSIPLPTYLDREELFRQVDMSTGQAFSIVDRHMGILLDILRGKEDASFVVELMGGAATEE